MNLPAYLSGCETGRHHARTDRPDLQTTPPRMWTPPPSTLPFRAPYATKPVDHIVAGWAGARDGPSNSRQWLAEPGLSRVQISRAASPLRPHLHAPTGIRRRGAQGVCTVCNGPGNSTEYGAWAHLALEPLLFAFSPCTDRGRLYSELNGLVRRLTEATADRDTAAGERRLSGAREGGFTARARSSGGGGLEEDEKAKCFLP